MDLLIITIVIQQLIPDFNIVNGEHANMGYSINNQFFHLTIPIFAVIHYASQTFHRITTSGKHHSCDSNDS